MSQIARILPPNSTQLEYALVDIAPRNTLAQLADVHANVDYSLPPSFQAWQAAEWHLSQFAKYFSSTKELITQGLPWLLQRGNAASVKMALGWIALSATLEEDDNRLQINPGNADAIHLSADIAALVQASIPAHVQLYRLFHVYDIRHARLDRSFTDGCMLDDDSGFYRDGVKLSFGRRQVGVPPAGKQAVIHSRSRRYPHSLRRDAEYLDSWNLDDLMLIDAYSGHGRTVFTTAPEHYPLPVIRSYRRVHYQFAALSLPAALPYRTRRHVAHARLRFLEHHWSGAWKGNWLPLVIPYNHTQTKV